MSRLKRWRLRRAYKRVYNDLQDVRLFMGIYDARNGNEHFMYGVKTVMSFVAHEAKNPNFTDVFMNNLVHSQMKAGVIDDED